jgi:5-methylcytosine-specific restriction endonuclease McrA
MGPGFADRLIRNWSGGPKRPHLSPEYREWRIEIFTRDQYTCRFCGLRSASGVEAYLHAHHVVPVSADKSKAFDLDNGLTLCVECHRSHH